MVHDFDRPHSAYMLFYERSEELEPIEKLLQASVPAAPTHSNAPTAGPLSKGLEVHIPGVHALHRGALLCTLPSLAWLGMRSPILQTA